MTKDGTCSFAYHGPSGAFVRGWTVPSKRDSPACPHKSQASEEVSPQATVAHADLDVQFNLINHNSSSQSGPKQGSYGDSPPHNESFRSAVRGPSQTAWTHLSDEMVQNLTSQGHEGVPTASTEDSIYINVADAGTPSRQGRVSMNATSGRDHQATPVDTTPFSPTDFGYKGAPPTGTGEKPFKCTCCSKSYKQQQALNRHDNEKHKPKLKCMYLDRLGSDCKHKWTRSRSYEYRIHLCKDHGLEDDKINGMLGTPRRRLRSRVVESNLPPQFSPAPTEHCRQSPAEPSKQRPAAPALLAVGKDEQYVSPPLIPSVAYNPPLGHAESEITATEHEDSNGLEHLAASHAPSTVLSGEEFALVARYLKFSIRNSGRIRFAHPFLYATYIIDSALRFPSAHSGGFSTDIPPNPGMLHAPALPLPVGGYYTNPVSGDPMVELSGSTDPYLYPGSGLF